MIGWMVPKQCRPLVILLDFQICKEGGGEQREGAARSHERNVNRKESRGRCRVFARHSTFWPDDGNGARKVVP